MAPVDSAEFDSIRELWMCALTNRQCLYITCIITIIFFSSLYFQTKVDGKMRIEAADSKRAAARFLEMHSATLRKGLKGSSPDRNVRRYY